MSFPTGSGNRSTPWIALALVLGLLGCAPEEEEAVQVGLAVVLVVDQLTPELMERYDSAFRGGFRRLTDGGLLFSDAVHDHAITFTSPGHATPTTGVIPARHGIVANSWREWEEREWQTVSSVADPETRLVGGDGSGSSPRNLLVDGFPDWLLQHDPASRVVSLSGKSTASVLMGPRGFGAAADDDRTHVYWFSVGSEGFVSSSHYRPELPDWVSTFNESIVDRFAADQCWEADLSADVAHLSRPDTVDYESDGIHTHFPHCPDHDPYDGPAHFLSRTPALDNATLALAEESVRALELGRGPAPDYLAIALSATDRVGHEFGPFSREQLDNLLRLDRELDRFFAFLDDVIGEGGYVVVLTSDHGVLPLPEYLAEQGGDGLRLTSELAEALEDAAEGLEGQPGAEARDAEAESAREEVARRIEALEWVEAGMTLETLASQSPADSFVELYRRSFHPERLSGRMATYGVEVRLVEGTLVRTTGTTHGVPYLHDRHVPFMFYGAGVEPGTQTEPVRTVDLAPTLAGILGVTAPEGLDGRPLF